MYSGKERAAAHSGNERAAAHSGNERAAVFGRRARTPLLAAAVLLALAAPLSLTGFWLQAALFAMAAAIGAVGLTLLVGVAGQLSLAHAFFVAVGAYGYAFLAGPAGARVAGAGWPPVLAAIGAVTLAGLAGALFSPVAGRLRGIYLGLASLALVFLGQHILQNATAVTGGFNGRDAAPLELFGFSFTAENPELVLFNVPFGPLERLWYVGLALLAAACWYARNLIRGRPGRALAGLRDSEVAAAVMGVDVRRYKAAVFVVSSAYAGLAGVLLALVFGRIVPDSFGLALSIDFLAMIIIGGPGSVAGSVAGAVLVTALPLVLGRYGDALPFLAPPGEPGVGAADAARLAYGTAVVAVLLFAPGGLTELARRATRLASAATSRGRSTPAGATTRDIASEGAAGAAGGTGEFAGSTTPTRRTGELAGSTTPTDGTAPTDGTRLAGATPAGGTGGLARRITELARRILQRKEQARERTIAHTGDDPADRDHGPPDAGPDDGPVSRADRVREGHVRRP